uniref:Uncharacterized protein n=1 Tax=Arundo donax TaxID=35708 RepID=A0A0A9FHF6_ARUDO
MQRLAIHSPNCFFVDNFCCSSTEYSRCTIH